MINPSRLQKLLTPPVLAALLMPFGTAQVGLLPDAALAGPSCSARQIGEKCTEDTPVVDAGSCSKAKGCNKITEWIAWAAPTGYAMTSFEAVNQSWNGGTFNVKKTSRGQSTKVRSEFDREIKRLDEMNTRIDALYKDAGEIANIGSKSETQAKLEAYSKELQENKDRYKSTYSAISNTDVVEMQAHSWYTCTTKVFGSCADGKGNHGKGFVRAQLVFIGDEAQIRSMPDQMQAKLDSLDAEIKQAKARCKDGFVGIPCKVKRFIFK